MDIDIKKSRLAVATFFFVNGFLHANLMARLPLFQNNLAISNSVLGSLLFLVALGALIGMPITGTLAQKFGSNKMARLTALLFCVFIPLIPMATDIWMAGIVMFLMGTNMGAMDVCMNGQAVFVERLWQKPIMASFHAVFSIGIALGASAGAIFSKLDITLPFHISIIAIFGSLMILLASPHLVQENVESTSPKEANSGFSLPNKAILPLGIIAFCCMTGEGSMTDWSAIYMNKVVGTNTAFSAIAFGVYASGMTIGRIFGDYTTLKLGKRTLMIYNSILAILGLGIALAYVSVASALVGFFMIGLGVSTIVPIVFSTAGNTEGINPSVGIAMATSIGYTGFFMGPPTIGFLSDVYSLRVGLGVSLFLFCLMYILILKFIQK